MCYESKQDSCFIFVDKAFTFKQNYSWRKNRSEMGGYTQKGIYEHRVLTRIIRKSRWGANAKAF